jgi:hypothetical protein
MHDGTITLDYMPSQFITFTLETGYRYSDVPYWSGRGGITPPGGNNGAPAQYACASGAPSGAGYGTLSLHDGSISYCLSSALGNSDTRSRHIWWPDLRTNQTNTTLAIKVRF